MSRPMGFTKIFFKNDLKTFSYSDTNPQNMFRTLFWIILACTLLLLSPAAAQERSWSTPFEVSENIKFSWFPDLAVGPEGSVHIIWGSGEADPRNPRESMDLLRYRELRDGVWSSTNEILFAATGGYTVRNSIALGRDGLFYILVRMKLELNLIAASWDNAWSARAWQEPQLITDNGYYTALTIDHANTIHAFWSEAVIDDPNNLNPNCPACSDLFYRRSLDGGMTWSQRINLSATQDDGENRPQAVVDRYNRIHAVWDQGVDWYAGAGTPKYGVYRRSDDGGATWSQPVLFGSPAAPVQQTAIAVSPAGDPFVVYRSAVKDLLYFQRSGDGGTTWTPPAEMPGVRGRDLNDPNLDRYSLVFDSKGHTHVLISGFLYPSSTERTNPWLLHLTFDGSVWLTPKIVMGNDLYPEWPKIEVYAGNQLHATWFTRHEDDLFSPDNNAHYQIWYSTLQVDSPAVAPLPLFTPVPTVPPTAEPGPTTPPPTMTPLPTAVLAAPLLEGSMQWEGPGLQVIAIALLPVLGLLALLWAFVAWRRQI